MLCILMLLPYQSASSCSFHSCAKKGMGLMAFVFYANLAILLSQCSKVKWRDPYTIYIACFTLWPVHQVHGENEEIPYLYCCWISKGNRMRLASWQG